MDTVIRLTSPPLEKGCRLVFGNPREIRRLEGESTARDAIFPPGKIFCLEIYERYLFGNTRWRLYVAESVVDPRKATFIPNVCPGARVLFVVKGKGKTAKALEWIEELKEKGDPTKHPGNFFLQKHGIINTQFEVSIPRKPKF